MKYIIHEFVVYYVSCEHATFTTYAAKWHRIVQKYTKW